MKVVVGSVFRDSTPRLAHYFQQMKRLHERLRGAGHWLTVVGCENDSKDETWEWLTRNIPKVCDDHDLFQVHDDCPFYPSIDYGPRWRHIAWVCNQILDRVPPCDVFVYVESDLSWDDMDMTDLIGHAKEYGAVSAPCYQGKVGGPYYDTWGSRLAGKKFSRHAPYADRWEPIMDIDSCASVLAVRGELVAVGRFSPDDCFLGWSQQVREANGGLKMATELAVVHP